MEVAAALSFFVMAVMKYFIFMVREAGIHCRLLLLNYYLNYYLNYLCLYLNYYLSFILYYISIYYEFMDNSKMKEENVLHSLFSQKYEFAEISDSQVAANEISEMLVHRHKLRINEWDSKHPLKGFAYVILLTSVTFNIFIFCYIGELLAEEVLAWCLQTDFNNNIVIIKIVAVRKTVKVSEKSYMIDWYRMPWQESPGIALMISMSRSTNKITAGKIIELSISSFGSFLLLYNSQENLKNYSIVQSITLQLLYIISILFIILLIYYLLLTYLFYILVTFKFLYLLISEMVADEVSCIKLIFYLSRCLNGKHFNEK
ncbi:hypothetical protein E2986_07795 [Frieseomelitta varia]|uniref:Uncharacterized protein n=1 Tax=Frieseomelitta varia TaxID=561572 RepID=A0A833RJ41_9HYME|nr:hypothetical protein E2986_07795 [Frieseomelitta varia]